MIKSRLITVTSQNPKSKALAIAAVMTAMISIQWGASLAKKLFPAVGPDGTTTYRLVAAALLLCLIWRPWRYPLIKKEMWLIGAYGFSLAFMNLLFYLAIERVPLGITVALEFTGPLGLALMSSRKIRDFLWAFFAVLGIFLILPLSAGATHLDPLGIVYSLGAGLGWALYIFFGQKSGGIHMGAVTSWGMLAAALMVLPFGWAHAGTELLNPDHWPLALGVAVFCSALPYNLDMIALKRIPRKNFGILMSLGPALATLSGMLFLGEFLTLQQILAIGCIVIASVGSSLTH